MSKLKLSEKIRKTISVFLTTCMITPALLVTTPEKVLASEAATVTVKTDSVLSEKFKGFGVQWEPGAYDPSEEDFQKIVTRLNYMKPTLVRNILVSTNYCYGYDDNGNPVYVWDTPAMNYEYKILDYCQQNNIDVMFGEWGNFGEPNAVNDELGDFSNTYSHSEGWDFDSSDSWYMGGDTTRIKVTSDTAQNIVYHKNKIKDFYTAIYFKGSIDIGDKVKFYASNDNTAWRELKAVFSEPKDVGGGWYKVSVTPSPYEDGFAGTADYLKTEVTGGSNGASLELSNMILSYTPESTLTTNGPLPGNDPKYAQRLCDILDYLYNEKGYTCIKWSNPWNEPNFGMTIDTWVDSMKSIKQELDARGLSSHISLIGPDESVSGDTDWTKATVNQLASHVGDYELHWYATLNQLADGSFLNRLKSDRDYINAYDPQGTSKDFLVGEAGILTGRSNGDQQQGVKEFWYGVSMANYAAQSMQAGMNGLIAWDLDDAMHPNNVPVLPLVPDENTLKVWGFWNTMGAEMGNPQDEDMRPWFYTWSLMSRLFPEGCKTLNSDLTSDISGLKVISAKKKNGGGYDMSFMLVNDSDSSKTVTLKVPGVSGTASLVQYNYFDGDMPVDENGFPVAKANLYDVDLSAGTEVSIPAKGVIFLTTMEGGTPVSILPVASNLIVNPGFENDNATWVTPPQGWTWTQLSGEPTGGWEWHTEAGNKQRSGSYMLEFWGAGTFESTVAQTFSNLPDGDYSFSAYVNANYDPSTIQLEIYAKGYNQPDTVTGAAIINGGSGYMINSIDHIQVTNGHCEVGLYIKNTNSEWGSWVQIDDVEFIRNIGTLVSGLQVSAVNGSPLTITEKSGTLQMQAEAYPEEATAKGVNWSVENGTGMAAIDAATGLLTAVSDGTVTVIATARDGSETVGSCEVTISGNPPSVRQITVSGQGGASRITTRNGSLQMQAIISPSNVADKSVIWSVVNNTGSATISETGLLTAVTDGTVTVTATATDGSGVTGTKKITITGNAILLNQITVNSQNGENKITSKGGTLQMVASVLPVNAAIKGVKWSVANGTGIASIDGSSGLLTAVADGTISVIATALDGSGTVSAPFEITITGNPVLQTGISVKGVNGINTITAKNGTLKMVAEITPSNAANKSVTWYVANLTGSAAINSETGVLTAISDGTVKIIAIAEDGSDKMGSCVVTISGQTSDSGTPLGGGSSSGGNTTPTPTPTPSPIPEPISTVKASDLKDAIESGKDYTVSVKDENGEEAYSWTFTKQNLQRADVEALSDIKLGLNVMKLDADEEINNLLTRKNENQTGLIIHFEHEGNLPVQASVKIHVGALGVEPDTTVYLYYYNPVTKKLDILPYTSKGYQVDKDGYITINIVHCSDYVILPNKADASTYTGALAQIVLSPAKLTLYTVDTEYGKGKIKVTMPSTLELVKDLKKQTSGTAVGAVTITYKSGNTKVASVDGDGVITAKSKGTAKITATVKLYSGLTKTFTTTVTVKEPGIRITRSAASMKLGSTYTFEAALEGYDKSDIVWTTSKKDIVVINKKTGKATAKTKGTDYVVAGIGTRIVKVKVVIK